MQGQDKWRRNHRSNRRIKRIKRCCEAPSVTIPSRSTFSNKSQRLDAIENAKSDIIKKRMEDAIEKLKLRQLWRIIDVHPLTRFFVSIPPMSWSYLALVVCCIVKVVFLFIMFNMLLHSYDTPLVYLLFFILIQIGSIFTTIEVLELQGKKIIAIGGVVNVSIIFVNIVLLSIISSDNNGRGIVLVERVAATTVAIAFLELLLLAHHYHILNTVEFENRADIESQCPRKPERGLAPSTSWRGSSRNRSSMTSSSLQNIHAHHHHYHQDHHNHICSHGPRFATVISADNSSHSTVHPY